MHGEGTDDLTTGDKGQGHLRPRLWQQWVFETHGLLADVQGDAGLGVGRAPAHHGLTTDLEPVTSFEHLATGLAGTGPQHGPAPCLVEEKEANVVEAETVADEVHRLAHQFVGVEHRGGSARDLGCCGQLHGAALQFARALGHTLLQAFHQFA